MYNSINALGGYKFALLTKWCCPWMDTFVFHLASCYQVHECQNPVNSNHACLRDFLKAFNVKLDFIVRLNSNLCNWNQEYCSMFIYANVLVISYELVNHSTRLVAFCSNVGWNHPPNKITCFQFTLQNYIM